MKAFLDIDGVLADFVAGALRAHGRPPDTVVDCWDFDKKLGIEPGAFWGAFGEEFWAGLDKTAEADEIASLACRVFGDRNVCLLSSPCRTPGCLEGKRRWVDRHFPAFSRRLLLGACKEFCAGPGRVLIDDSDANVRAFRDAGGEVLLVPRPWNLLAGLDPLEHLRRKLTPATKEFTLG